MLENLFPYVISSSVEVFSLPLLSSSSVLPPSLLHFAAASNCKQKTLGQLRPNLRTQTPQAYVVRISGHDLALVLPGEDSPHLEHYGERTVVYFDSVFLQV